MTIDASWLPDPSGRHELRYWSGAAWTDHVSDGGETGTDPAGDLETPIAAGRQVKPAKQWAGDSLWEGERKTMTGSATGMVRARYRMTAEYLYFDAGLVSNKSEQIPLWAVRDVDVKQSMTQKARNVGDVIVRCQHDDYTGRPQVTCESIEDPKSVRDLINQHAGQARLEHQRRGQTQIYQGLPVTPHSPAPIPASPESTAPTLVAQLKELAELRDAGILTDEEFAAQKTKLLNG